MPTTKDHVYNHDHHSNFLGCGKGIDIHSELHLELGNDGDYFIVTGTDDIEIIVTSLDRKFSLQFSGILTIINSEHITIPGGVDFVTSVGDILHCFSTAHDVVQITGITKTDGKAVVSESVGDQGPVGDQPEQTINSLGDVSGVQDIDLNLGNTVTGTIGTGTVQFTFSNPKESGTACQFRLILTDGGSQTIVYPQEVVWENDVFPILSFSGIDTIDFLTTDGGLNWYGSKVRFAQAEKGYDLNNLSPVVTSRSTLAETDFVLDLTFNDDGTRLFIIEFSASNYVLEYHLDEPFSITTGSSLIYKKPTKVSGESITGLVFNNVGTKLFISVYRDSKVREYHLGTSFDISTLSPIIVSASVPDMGANISGLAFNNDGSKLYLLSANTNRVGRYDLTTPFDLSTISKLKASAIISEKGSAVPNGLTFSRDGSKLFIVYRSPDMVREWHLATPFDVLTLSELPISESLVQVGRAQGVRFNNDGTQMFIIDYTLDIIYGYDL